MPMRLIYPNEERCIEIDGTKIFYKRLNGQEQAKMQLALYDLKIQKGMNPEEAGAQIAARLDKIEPIITKHIIRVENPDIAPQDLLGMIADLNDYGRVAFGILNDSMITEDEAKNSGCSSGSDAPKDAGTARAATTENA